MQGKHGDIVSWSVRGTYKASRIKIALAGSGLNEKECRDLIPRNAFARICKELADQRIIKKLDESPTTINFQFTKEYMAGDRFEYEYETVLTLEKKTGRITCDIRELADKATEAMVEVCEHRTAPDVTRIIQRVFTKNADLFPVREQGGCYFVPKDFSDILQCVTDFCEKLQIKLGRFPVVAGDPSGDASVRDVVVNGLRGMIEEHREAIEKFDPNTPDAVFERTAMKLKVTKHKLESYSEFLQSEQEKLEEELAKAKEILTDKMLRM